MNILLFIDDLATIEPLWEILAVQDNHVVAVDSLTETCEELSSSLFDLVLVRGRSFAELRAVEDHQRKENLPGRVRAYQDLCDLVAGDSELRFLSLLLNFSQEATSSLMVSLVTGAHADVPQIRQLVQQFCSRLRINPGDRMIIESAATLHDLGHSLFGHPNSKSWNDWLKRCDDSSRSGTGPDRQVILILKLIQHHLANQQPDRVTLVELGASVLNLVDHTVHLFPNLNELPISYLERIKTSLESQANKLYLPELVEPFLMMLREEVLKDHRPDKQFRISYLNKSGEDRLLLGPSLTNLDFLVRTTLSVDDLCEDIHRFKPDLLLLRQPGRAGEVNALLSELAGHGISSRDLPIFLIVDRPCAGDSSVWLRKGIEDVHLIDTDADSLLVKLVRARDRLELQSKLRLSVLQDMGTHGSLEDMNVIDLLQAMGVSGKTCRISITAYGKQLTAYLQTGQLIYAECEGQTGPRAVYLGIPWKTGVWCVDPVKPQELPEPKNSQSIDSILLEGCQLIDEQVRPETARLPIP